MSALYLMYRCTGSTVLLVVLPGVRILLRIIMADLLISDNAITTAKFFKPQGPSHNPVDQYTSTAI